MAHVRWYSPSVMSDAEENISYIRADPISSVPITDSQFPVNDS